MNKMLAAILVALFTVGVAQAQTDADKCAARAVDKNGKALAGAARDSFMKKCQEEGISAACESRAIGKNGKALAGAAKTAFMKKCEADSAK
ncbi:MAG: hypothetical protein LBE62_04435 [Azonexus sp.]|jgi:hypothetical protein|nr:hypothetical protein [Azonexus sp.]